MHWQGETYTDGVTLQPETFYRWLEVRDEFPKTSQPAVGELVGFVEYYAAYLYLSLFKCLSALKQVDVECN